jgi:two-component system response regulator DegU
MGALDKCKKKLTSREFEILREIVHGLSNKEISNKFKISNNTVKAHLKNIYKKLGVRNRWELITQFYRED